MPPFSLFCYFPCSLGKRALHYIYHKKCKLVMDMEQCLPEVSFFKSWKPSRKSDINHKSSSLGVHLDFEHFLWDNQPSSTPESSAEQSQGKSRLSCGDMSPPVQHPQIFPRPADCPARAGIHWWETGWGGGLSGPQLVSLLERRGSRSFELMYRYLIYFICFQYLE